MRISPDFKRNLARDVAWNKRKNFDTLTLQYVQVKSWISKDNNNQVAFVLVGFYLAYLTKSRALPLFKNLVKCDLWEEGVQEDKLFRAIVFYIWIVLGHVNSKPSIFRHTKRSSPFVYLSLSKKICLLVLFCLNERLPEGRKVGIPLEILSHVWEQNKCSYFPRPGQS